jgi:murein DD-endopeptidase MepM/ murein hydrolase activator NlpD
LKRAFPQKVKPASAHLSPSDAEMASSRPTSPGVNRRARTSAAMIGLAISMGASSILLPRHADSAAAAAESQSPESAMTAVPESKAAIAWSGESAPGSELSASTSTALVTLRVQRGQTLWKIAHQYQLTVDQLAAANGIHPESILQVGQLIRVPVSESALSTLQTVNSGIDAPESADGELTLALVPAKPQASQSDLSNAAANAAIDIDATERDAALSRLRVQREELREVLSRLPQATSTGISRVSKRQANAELLAAQTGVSVQAVSKPQASSVAGVSGRTKPGTPPGAIASATTQASDLPSDLELEVASIEVPTVPQSTAVAAAMADSPGFEQSASVPPSVVAHQVAQGETISSIARTYQISSASLVAVNRLSNPDFIRAGQTIQVPAEAASAQGKLQAETALAQPVAAPSTVVPATSSSVPITLPTVPGSSTVVDNTVGSVFSSEVIDATGNESRPETVPPTATVAPKLAPETPAPTVTLPTADVPMTATQASNISSNAYVARLMSDFNTLGDRASSPAQPIVDPAPAIVSVAPGQMNPELRPAQAIESASAKSPAMERQSRQSAVSGGSGGAPQVVAVAPLGSESYEPLLQPVTGRLVSPDLPPLPGADTFLPNGNTVNGFIWPARGILTSGYGWRWGRMHRGIDVAGPVGTPIHAAADGVVQFSGWNSGGYGKMVEIRHADGSMTRYAHNSRNLVQVGQRVQQGQQIAEMGSTGFSTGPHVHFEVHLPNQGTVNPIAMLPGR